jgi:hypothetical protein
MVVEARHGGSAGGSPNPPLRRDAEVVRRFCGLDAERYRWGELVKERQHVLAFLGGDRFEARAAAGGNQEEDGPERNRQIANPLRHGREMRVCQPPNRRVDLQRHP